MRTFKDIIIAAKEVSQCGFQLNQLANEIAREVRGSVVEGTRNHVSLLPSASVPLRKPKLI